MDILEFKQLVEEYGEVVAKLRIDELILKEHKNILHLNLEIAQYPEVLKFLPRNDEVRILATRLIIVNPTYWQFVQDIHFTKTNWSFILANRPDTYDICPCVNEFSKVEWLRIINIKSDLMKYFPFWDDLTSTDLYTLLFHHYGLAHLLNFDQLTAHQTFHLFTRNPPYSDALRMDKVDYDCVMFRQHVDWAGDSPSDLPLTDIEIRLLKHASTLSDWEDRKAANPRFRLLDQTSK